MRCSVERLIEALIGMELAQERKAAEEKAAAARAASFVVTVSRGFGALGREVAEALAAKGLAAFVLKYRLNQTAADLNEFANPTAPQDRRWAAFGASYTGRDDRSHCTPSC